MFSPPPPSKKFHCSFVLFYCIYFHYFVLFDILFIFFLYFQKLRLLCCPAIQLPSANSRQSLNSTSSLSQGSTNSAFLDDPPPKYTPPPSYSTATSRILAKQLDSQRQKLNNSCTLDFDDENPIDCENPHNSLPNSRENILPTVTQQLCNLRNFILAY